jgi:hypothetical protein
MADTPMFEALLAELCGLDEQDMQLPLPVLVNLHRARLRAPLRGLSVYAGELPLDTREGVRTLQDRLQETYGLEGGLLETQEVLDLYGFVDNRNPWGLADANGTGLTEAEEYLIEAADADWLSFDPLVWLCFLAYPGLVGTDAFRLIEAELGVQPAAHRMILDMAALAPEPHGKTS